MTAAITRPPPTPDARIDRRFEAVVADWTGTSVSAHPVDTRALKAAIESACALGIDVAVISDTNVASVDGQLGARPAGPGRLYLCVNRGSEAFVVDENGARLLAKHVEIGLTDESDPARWVLERLARDGIAPHEVLFVGDVGSMDERVERATALLEDQVRRRRQGELPTQTRIRSGS